MTHIETDRQTDMIEHGAAVWSPEGSGELSGSIGKEKTLEGQSPTLNKANGCGHLRTCLGLECVSVLDEVTDPVRAGSKYQFPVCLSACSSSGGAGEKSTENLLRI